MKTEEGFPRDLEEIRSRVHTALQEKYAHSADNWTHVSGGSETGATWRRSLDAFEGVGFVPRAIHGVIREEVDLSVEVLGSKWDLPIGIAPMSGVIAAVCENAFTEMAAGAKEAGVPASVGYPAAPEIHGKMAATGAAVFRIVKPLRDVEKLSKALTSAQEEGCFAVGVDTDSVAGLKRGDLELHEGMCGTLSLEVLKDLRDSVDLPFIVKGVLSTEDALAAVEIGADAIVVSTHSGSALDYCPSSLEVLPAIVRTVDKRAKVLFDSGIRREATWSRRWRWEPTRS